MICFFLRQHFSCCKINFIPFFTAQNNIGCFTYILNSFQICTSYNCLDSCGMTHNPCNCDCILCYPIRSNTLFSSGNFSFPINIPSNIPYWNGDHACNVIFFSLAYSIIPPSRSHPASLWMFTFSPASIVGQ